MLSSLHAEESIRVAECFGVGVTIKSTAARGILAQWRRDLGRDGSRQSAGKASPEMLAAMGIGYRIVTKDG